MSRRADPSQGGRQGWPPWCVGAKLKPPQVKCRGVHQVVATALAKPEARGSRHR